MAGFGPDVCSQSEAIHSEHQLLLERLAGLEAALDAIICYSEVYADLASSEEVVKTGRWLAAWLPEHFQREEGTVLKTVSALGPDMAAFAAEMVRQHHEIGSRLRAFCKIATELEQTADLQDSICDLKESGKALTRFMSTHMAAEERKLNRLDL